MTNYEKIKSLTVEEMACLNVKQNVHMYGYRPCIDFYTTDQNIFDTREEAEEYERKWLLGEVGEDVFDVLLYKKGDDE